MLGDSEEDIEFKYQLLKKLPKYQMVELMWRYKTKIKNAKDTKYLLQYFSPLLQLIRQDGKAEKQVAIKEETSKYRFIPLEWFTQNISCPSASTCFTSKEVVHFVSEQANSLISDLFVNEESESNQEDSKETLQEN